MDVWLYLAIAIGFFVGCLLLMTSAARKGRLALAAFFGAMAVSTPLSYPLALMRAGSVSAPVGLFIILALVSVVVWLARRAYRAGPRREAVEQRS